MKSCVRCAAGKSESDFYPSDKTCKECRKALVRANRADKIDYYKEYDKGRAILPKRVQMRERYQATVAGATALAKAKARYIERNPIKRAAHVAVGNALRSGSLWKSPCCMAPDCFSTTRLHAHHTVYSRKLCVVWLCNDCHVTLHNEHDERHPE